MEHRRQGAHHAGRQGPAGELIAMSFRLELVTGRTAARCSGRRSPTTRRGSSPCSSGAARHSRYAPVPRTAAPLPRVAPRRRGALVAHPPLVGGRRPRHRPGGRRRQLVPQPSPTPPSSGCWSRTRASTRASARALLDELVRQRPPRRHHHADRPHRSPTSRHVHRMLRRLGPTTHRVQRHTLHLHVALTDAAEALAG